ncbi:NmrA/HSCARG family protein [Alcanivorax sp.]|uniref:NmrA/HSCARG family protein n=1 Tax=Alcanivorax sp. TaxID=1872427 RepID=UPI0025C38623|nr:NmrA/HSCARG family protein [Alcanivorax sp.]
MTDQRILVTGATGAQGGALIPLLLEKGFSVRALTRNPDKPAAKALAREGVEVVAGDLDDSVSLQLACKECYGVFALQNFWEKDVGYQREIDQGIRLADAAAAAGVQHFLQTSVAGCEEAGNVLHFASKWQIEQHIEKLGLPFTMLREVFFMENFFEPVMGNKGKKAINPALVLATLDGCLDKDVPFHMVTVDDIARASAEIFANPDKFIGTRPDLASDVLTVAQMKHIYRKVTGKRPLPFRIPLWALRLSNAEAARQYVWNNTVRWRFDVDAVRKDFPFLTSFETFLRQRLAARDNKNH